MRLDQAPPATVRTVFLKNQKPPQPAPLPLTPSLAANTPTPNPATIRQPIPVHTPLLSSSIQPEMPQNPALIAALPIAELLHLHATLVSVAPATAIYPGMARCIAIADGLRTAMRAGLPHSNSIRSATRQSDPATSALNTTYSSGDLQSLPVSGRRWEELFADSSSTAVASGSQQESSGITGRQISETSIGGESTQLAFGNGSASASGSRGQSSSAQDTSEPPGMGQAWSGGRLGVSETAVRSVQTFTASAGAYADSGSMRVETQSGANALHGQGFLFDRQNTWGARNPSAQWVRETAAATATTLPVFTSQPFTPPDHEISWGVGAGSRIRRDKLFWFAALDGMARNDPALSTVKWPEKFFA